MRTNVELPSWPPLAWVILGEKSVPRFVVRLTGFTFATCAVVMGDEGKETLPAMFQRGMELHDAVRNYEGRHDNPVYLVRVPVSAVAACMRICSTVDCSCVYFRFVLLVWLWFCWRTKLKQLWIASSVPPTWSMLYLCSVAMKSLTKYTLSISSK